MKRRKLFYVPGLISLIGLPLLLIVLSPSDPVPQTVARIVFPSDDLKPDPPGIMRFTKWHIYHDLKHKKIVSVDLDEKVPYDEGELPRFRHAKKLDFISNEIARRQFTHDTSSVLKIQLGDDCTYGDFVWVLNQAKVYEVRRFSFIDDAYFLYTTPPPNREPVEPLSVNDIAPSIDLHIISPKEIKPTRLEIFKKATAAWFATTIPLIKRNYIYLSGFLLLILIPAFIGLRKKTPLKTKKTIIFI